MPRDHLLALDQGTSSSRAIVFHRSGRIVAQAQQELHQHFPQPGWVEHDADEIWAGQIDTAREALKRAGLVAGDIAAIGITNQRETTLLWNRHTGRPIHHAIVWQDRRTEPLCAQLRAQPGVAEQVRQATGLVIDPYFSATKIRWLLDHVTGAHIAAARGELAFGTIDSWLLWKLTGGHVHATDVSNAARTMLFDIRHGVWDHELLKLLHVPDSLLPAVFPSSHLFGETDPALFGAAIPIAGIAGDQQAALFGQACFAPGLVKNTYGTGCFMLMHTGGRLQLSTHGLVSTAAAQVGDKPAYALEGSVFVGGAVVQWLRDGLQAIKASGEVQALAESVPDAGGVVVVPAFTGLGAPYWQADARGAVVGLSRGTTMAHIARAALESIAFQSAALLQAMAADVAAHGGAPVSELRVDGGASVNDLLMQFQADLLGVPVVRPMVTETTALGAAYLAGLATGVYRGTDELAALWQAERRFFPTLAREQAAERMARWERAVRQTVAV
ncbi:glycerol kinase GlpK [Pseudorhodoferax sp.]|uniref:glycerol kinase GlpK n=1 Tax=Pseudorhodoferax sp. TaxID=1993553 RepID=UPI002DD691EC|nr:glycerol kinase GlpK [Pseudorhodoferax sp.]